MPIAIWATLPLLRKKKVATVLGLPEPDRAAPGQRVSKLAALLRRDGHGRTPPPKICSEAEV
jgi:hypothetical protein